ncbi:hypothetical protein TSMEX_010503, partial [Taenia solium]
SFGYASQTVIQVAKHVAERTKPCIQTILTSLKTSLLGGASVHIAIFAVLMRAFLAFNPERSDLHKKKDRK